MTTRVLCLWIPNWSVQRLQVRQPGLRNRPLVLFADGPRDQPLVVTHDQQAAALGVRPGMPLAEAQTLCLDRDHHDTPRFVCRDTAADVESLKRLAWSCEPFSPLVGLEQSGTPESLLLDITGCGQLFDGEDRLARQLQRHVAQGGLRVRIAVAETVGAAWALAHCAPRSDTVMCISGEQTRQTLGRLPVSALRLPSGLIARLHEFQLRRVDQVLALDRSILPSRFGEQLLWRIDQAFGRVPEPITPERRPKPIEANWKSDDPLQSAPAMEVVMTRLLDDVLQRLQAAGAAIQRLQVHLSTPEGQTLTWSVDCVRPTTALPHLLELLRLRWERESFPQGICRVRLSVLQVGTMTQLPLTLWSSVDKGDDFELLRLIERLSSRLGAEAILRPSLLADAQPEHSFTYESAHRAKDTSEPAPHREKVLPTAPPSLSRLIRPAWLLPAPVRIDVLLAGEAGPPCRFRWGQDYHVIGHWGPERITTGWWRDEYIRRDYYHVQTAKGRRFWIFKNLLNEDWFLHATGE